jgi:hypothetical protein
LSAVPEGLDSRPTTPGFSPAKEKAVIDPINATSTKPPDLKRRLLTGTLLK